MMRKLLRFVLLSMSFFALADGSAVDAAASHSAIAAPARSWVDKRVDALTAQQLSTLAPSALVDPIRANVAASLADFRRPVFFLWAFAQIGALFFMWRTGFSARIREAIAARVHNVLAVRAIFAVTITALVSLVSLPFSLVSLHLALTVGVSHETFANFLHDYLLSVSINVVIAAFIVTFGLALVERVRMWYLYAVGLFIAFGLIALIATPVVVDPLYRTLKPIPTDTALGMQLYGIERAAGVGHIPIFLSNLSRTSEVGNANVEGIGPTTRVIVGDTLLHTATRDEISFIMGHELGHLANGDPLYITLLADLLTIIAIAAAVLTAERISARGDDDPLSRLTLIAALVGIYSLVVFPFGNAYSNQVEARADRFGLAVTGEHIAAARMFVRFADEGFSPVCPPRIVRLYFYDHPPLGSRIMAATGRADACP